MKITEDQQITPPPGPEAGKDAARSIAHFELLIWNDTQKAVEDYRIPKAIS